MAQRSVDLTSQPFACRVTLEGEALRLALFGELDLAGIHELDRCTAEVLQRRPEVVYVDLRGLLFIDVVGSRSLARAIADMTVTGATVRVTGTSRSIERTLAMTGVDLPGDEEPTTTSTAATPDTDPSNQDGDS